MRHKSIVKKILKTSFITIQALVFIFSICMTVISFTVYHKGKNLFQMPVKSLFLMLSISLTSAASSLIGFQILNTKKRVKLFIYTFLSLVLLNLLIILAIKSSLLPEKSAAWGESVWESMDDSQRIYIEKKFKCCGFRDQNDRSALKCENNGCFSVLYKISIYLRYAIERCVVLLFFIESTGLAIMALLKLRK